MNWKIGDIARYKPGSLFDAIVRIVYKHDSHRVDAIILVNIAGSKDKHKGWVKGHRVCYRHISCFVPVSPFKQQLKELL